MPRDLYCLVIVFIIYMFMNVQHSILNTFHSFFLILLRTDLTYADLFIKENSFAHEFRGCSVYLQRNRFEQPFQAISFSILLHLYDFSLKFLKHSSSLECIMYIIHGQKFSSWAKIYFESVIFLFSFFFFQGQNFVLDLSAMLLTYDHHTLIFPKICNFY